MAGSGDKCIGNLTLDISDVQKKINEVNAWLGKIGADINLEDKLSKKISAALNKLVEDAKKAGAEAKTAMDNIGSATSERNIGKIGTQIEHVTGSVKTYVREVNAAGDASMKLSQTVTTGMNQAGHTIKEFSDATGNITKRTEAVKRSLEEEEELAWKAYEAEQEAEGKKVTAAVDAALKREQASEKASQKEQERISKEVSMMDESLSKEEANLEKQIAAYEAAEEKKRQASINAEFERDEARQRSAAAEEEVMAKELAMMDEAVEKQQADLDKQVTAFEEAEEKKRQAAIQSEFEREEARKRALQSEQETIAQEVAMMEQSFQTARIDEAESAYKRLTTAIKEYQVAKKTGNQEQQAYWQNEMDSAMTTLNTIEKILPELNLEESARQRIANAIQAGKTQMEGFQKGVVGTSQATGELESQVKSLATRYLSLMAVIRTISSLIRNMVDYVSEYSNKMNEIQMITLKTDEEVAELAETYRNLAADMSVSSLDMADAAIYFTRQGLAAEEIEKRLKNVTMYAKAANVEFRDASEIITAVVNSMGLVEQEAEDGRNATQRVADVFLTIGDNAATSGQEIGEAMQKAAASAGAFGVSMEWLAAYIAAVSETTRQEARTIGTALNTIIARLHQIKQKGYNEEDETKINDVAKALSNIDVALMDQEGNWRDMEDIFVDISKQWDDLDGKTKSYIATTMAGVKQQNVFLALMNDMAKAVDGNSRAFELHELALNSDGAAAEKYSVYLDGVTASQERLNVAREKFYALLDDSVIKTWNNALSGIINWITDATKAFGGLNIIIPLVTGAVYLLSVAFGKLAASAVAAGGAMALLQAHPVILAITAVTAGIIALTAAGSKFVKESEDMVEAFNKASAAISDSQDKINRYLSVQEKVAKMSEMTSDELDNYGDSLNDIAKISPFAENVINKLKQGFITQKEAAEELNSELERLIENERRVSLAEGIKKYSNYTDTGDKTQGIAKMMLWGDTFAFDNFRQQLAAALYAETSEYNKAVDKATYQFKYFTKEAYDELQALQSSMAQSKVDNETRNGVLADWYWNYLFGTYDTESNPMEALAKKVNDEIDNALDLVDMEAHQRVAAESLLKNIIFGEDGELSVEEYGAFSAQIAKFLTNVYRNGIDEALGDLETGDYAKLIVEQLFGSRIFYDPDVSSMLFAYMYDEDWSRQFIEAYSDLIAKGFDNEDIYALLQSKVPIKDWVNMVELMREDIIEGLRDNMDETIGEDFISVLFGDDWEEMDFDIANMINNLLDAEIPIERINEAASHSESIDEFRAKLRDLAEDEGIDLEETSENAVKSLKDLQNEVKSARQEIDKIDNALENLRAGKDLKFEDLLDLTMAHPEIAGAIGDIDSLKAALESLRGTVIGDFGDKVSNLMWNSEEIAKGVASTQGYELMEGETLQEYRDRLEMEGESTEDLVAFIEGVIEALKNAREELDASEESWLEAQAEKIRQQQELSAAEAEGFRDQLSAMDITGGGEGITGIKADLLDAISTFNDMDASMKESIAKTYPNLILAIDEANKVYEDQNATLEDVKKAQKNLNTELAKAQKYNNAKYFKDTYNAAKKLSEGTMSVSDAYDVMYKEINNVSKAYEDVLDVQNKMSAETAVTTNDVSNLSKVLNMSAEDILADWPAAIEMFNDLTSSTGELQDAINMLNAAAFIKITGVSEADFSNIENGLIAVQKDAQDTIDMLLATGQWELVTVDLPASMPVYDIDTKGKPTVGEVKANGYQTILKAKGNNPFGKRTSVKDTTSKKSGGGGGGGGSDKEKNESFRDKNVTTEIEKMLDMMSQIDKIQKHAQDYYQAMQSYYQSTGQLQGVIAYMKRETEVLTSHNKTLENNIKSIKQHIEVKRAELNSLSESDEKYDEVADDLEKLQNAYYDYTQQVIENKTAINNLNEAMKEQQRKIRQMEIDLENEILQAIMDRENKKKDMLSAEIQMENTILEIIKARYEQEREDIVRNTEMKIEALEQERDLLDEQLRIRKEQKEEEDKMTQLRELEAKYQRIIADPTRAKEAQKIRDDIDKLREEMAWDLAEKEVEAQQESIDQQITSLEDYLEYVENYYNDLFEHPQKLIKETEEIMKRSEQDIIEWLKANDENYKNSSENTQQHMVETWEETYETMKGIVKTYWTEVQDVISKGDDYIIEFLKNNSKKYAEASKKQAEAYVDEWKKQLDDLRKAHEQVAAQIAKTYAAVPQGNGSGSSSSSGSGGSGGSGGGGGGGGGDTTDHGYRFTAVTSTGRTYERSDHGYASAEAAKTAALREISGNMKSEINKLSGRPGTTTYDYAYNQITARYKKMQDSIVAYATGGLATSTGPAWLDGTKQNPERVLSPYQTKLFESMVQALERVSTIPVASMSNMSGMQTGNNNQVSVGDIIVNVDNLDTDDDYEDLARKVGEVLMEEIGKTAVIGGLHIRSI